MQVLTKNTKDQIQLLLIWGQNDAESHGHTGLMAKGMLIHTNMTVTGGQGRERRVADRMGLELNSDMGAG